jgi:Ni,Fe-hydrogenase III large subunit
VAFTLPITPATTAWHVSDPIMLTIEGERISDADYRPFAGEPARQTQLRLSFDAAVQQAARACPICTNAHVLACCQAIEALSETQPPPRATYLRVALAEIERAASHTATLATLFMNLGLANDSTTLKAISTSLNAGLTTMGAPMLIIPGGIAADVPSTQTQAVREELDQHSDHIFNLAQRAIKRRGVLSRTIDIGTLSTAAASGFGLSGPIARASGLQVDTRIDEPYAAYADLRPEGIVQSDGDVYARLVQLILETLESLKLAVRALIGAPQGVRLTPLPEPVVSSAVGIVEAPRGPLRYQIEHHEMMIEHVSVSVAPQLDRLLARSLLRNTFIDDAVLVLSSTDPCSHCTSASNGRH